MSILQTWPRSRTVICVLSVLIAIVLQVTSLNGPNVCMVQQKYNITKRVRYRAPMSVRTYEWCFSMPPRCSRWKTEMRDLTKLETEERTAEVAVCCPGYKMKDVTCVPICPNGKTGSKCTEDCPPNKWGPNCINECVKCLKGICSPITGDCECLEGWQGESCNIRMTTPPPPALMEEILTTTKSTLQTLPDSTKTATSAKTINFESTTPVTYIYNSSPIINTYIKPEDSMITTKTIPILPTEDAYNNDTILTTTTSIQTSSIIVTPPKLPSTTFVYNRTETPTEGMSTNLTSAHVTSTFKPPLSTKITRNVYITTPISSTIYSIPSLNTLNQISTTTETVKKIETTTKFSNPSKFKPKEIWIRPTQKGLSTEFKIKASHELSHIRNGIKNESSSEITTLRTIIVSIIPTSVSHASFKKIALTTASYLPKNINGSKVTDQSVEPGFTKSMTRASPTRAPFTIKILTTKQRNLLTTSSYLKHITKPILPKSSPKKSLPKTSPFTVKPSSSVMTIFNTSTSKNKSTNSMTSSSSPIRKSFYSTNALQTSTNKVFEITTKATENLKDERIFLKDEIYRSGQVEPPTSSKKFVATNTAEQVKTTILVKIPPKKTNERNITKPVLNPITTESPPEDETFHILTEPEHITAIMTDKDREKSSLDLIYVVSVVGGIMMAVITVAVLIVMFERCRRPRYDDIMKMHDIQMRAMMGNDDPPPYARSIFHTPLPDPPSSEKCHYQPISTLDRNLKQFMRPVIVQNISPIMLENFRGILECHYDHLPQRSHIIETSARSSIAPSNHEEQQCHRTIGDYTIDGLKCEAKLDIIDSINAEPLYAEIPCWRPPSEHAVEVMNLNGEAVTEL